MVVFSSIVISKHVSWHVVTSNALFLHLELHPTQNSVSTLLALSLPLRWLRGIDAFSSGILKGDEKNNLLRFHYEFVIFSLGFKKPAVKKPR